MDIIAGSLPCNKIPSEFVYFANTRYSILAGIVKIPPKKGTVPAFADLICTNEDLAIIQEILTTMAANGKVTLLLNQSYMYALGDRIRHVHPLKFLAVIFTDAQLKSCMQVIFEDYFKRSGFIDELSIGLSEHLNKGTLHIYVEEFSKAVGAPFEKVQQFCKTSSWEDLVIFLTKS